MNSYIMTNQPIIFKDSQQSNKDNLKLIQPLVNNNNNNTNNQIKYSNVPMTRRNYTYMANVNVPSVTHIIAPANQPHLPTFNNNGNYISTKLPRVLPPPNTSYYTSTVHQNNNNNNITPITSSSSSSGNSDVGTPNIIQRRKSLLSGNDSSSSPVYNGDSISPSLPPFKSFDSTRRHSVSLAVLDDPIQQLRQSQQQQQSTMGVIVKDENNNLIVPLVQMQQERLSVPNIKTESEILLPNDIALHNVGERYNDKGELIGRSGKVLRDTKRAAQNRCAQKAFRIRREKYIKNLEIKSKQFDGIASENSKLKSRIEELEKLLQNSN
ncbi:similar to Saccharomyces cerevisiae YDR259C YAP6 Putative basic leucine zipper (bZIP) transcription factor [Maudiozyma saulgeensis]|uniref:Similar to Saccharomyces cerevisiae YDR259C YAP6 Putative basic leucine zipper (BZIP) transcription factor n=1 Tax=Maudiozyma saulgeensis TaxID=1789683 RepID=A0A1X7QWQ5_9SACH|nr:similar to Saccharomyces cerevisiae YDR259C YAP6 Putative basic leucine zipper (bZIP) transcription factor [Kazachstania saulgeensis]